MSPLPSGLAGLFAAGGVGQQFVVWGVLQQLLGAALVPVVTQIQDEVWQKLPSARLSPEQAAELVLKGWWDFDTGAAEARQLGITEERFRTLLNGTGEPISIQDALQALRRGVLDWERGKGGPPSVMEAIRQSRLRDEWADTLRELQWIPLPVSDAVDAVVESQIPYDQGEREAGYNGIKPEHFRVLYNTRGNPPSPTELLEANRRGLIEREGTGPDAITVQQGIYEGATKNKWYPVLAALAEYLPPPRTVTALEREGSITPEQAQHLYQQSGLSPELAAIYAASASHQKLQRHRDLGVDTVLRLYQGHALSQEQATGMLEALGHTAQEATWLLTLRDVERSLAAVERAITKVGTLYVARKLTANDTLAALGKLGLPSDQVAELMATWEVERTSTVRTLSEAQIASAYKKKIIGLDVATRYLAHLGYSAYDAWVLISEASGEAQGQPPSEGANVGDRAQ